MLILSNYILSNNKRPEPAEEIHTNHIRAGGRLARVIEWFGHSEPCRPCSITSGPSQLFMRLSCHWADITHISDAALVSKLETPTITGFAVGTAGDVIEWLNPIRERSGKNGGLTGTSVRSWIFVKRMYSRFKLATLHARQLATLTFLS